VVAARRAAGVEPLGELGGAGPVVLVTMDRDAEGPWVSASYVEAVLRAGGRPWLVAPGAPAPERLVAAVDAVVVTGGAFDIHPRHYGRAVEARLDRTDEDRTDTELGVVRAALDAGVPLLGVCGGMQAMAVATGGTLVQDLPAEPTHEQPTDPATPWHAVRLTGGLAASFGASVEANSTHHQAVRTPGAGQLVEGWSTDGVPEAVRFVGVPYAVGVQWHPELLGQDAWYARLVASVHPRAWARRGPGRP
jgi:gamma-glutamyl-gamma-aminobutyrate hydrolase PuuD